MEKKTKFIHVFYSAILLLNCFSLSKSVEQKKLQMVRSQKNNKIVNNGKDVSMNLSKIIKKTPVIKKVLDNGLTVLVYETHNIPKVSLQLWYNVGSKDEKDGERGIAHLIEHMIFKGTEKLSESDINIVSHMLSGSINAFTSYDYTGYLFNFPTQNWHEALPIMADCMLNCVFKDEHLNSEMKAVIQELKMYRDDYNSTLISDLISSIFPDHPYHYPIIGFKQDLWSVNGRDLHSFYKKHYLPNNATLVVAGDVKAQEVFELAQKQFGSIPANFEYKKENFYFNEDIISKSVTLYREVQQPLHTLVYVTPGISQGKENVLEIASWILGTGKGSRLYKKIVDEEQLATSLSSSFWDLFEHSLFFIMFEPKDVKDIAKIEALIQAEIDSIVKDGLSEQEVTRAIKKAQMKLYSTLENTEQEAYDIGKYYLATGDENYVFNYLNTTNEQMAKEVVDLLRAHFRPTVTHRGTVLPLPESEKAAWEKLQKLSDAQDAEILSARVRETAIGQPLYANSIEVKEPTVFSFPKSKSETLSNGLKVLYYNNQNGIPKINVIVEFKARPFYDSQEKPGLYSFMMDMLSEGTEKYSASELAQEIESRGMSFSAGPGSVSMTMLAGDFQKGLEILNEILTHATFNEDSIEKVRDQIEADIKNFWDEPSSFAGQLLREQIYKGHPYSKNLLGTTESIQSITQKDLISFYKKYITPKEAKIAIVGDLQGYNVAEMVEAEMKNWKGDAIESMHFPALDPIESKEINHPINRDQVVLCYGGLSVDRRDADYDKLVLFDQIFGHGALGSMHSKLFQLREQSGLFYTINGSLTANSDDQPGMVLIKTIVSLDRLQEAEKAIKGTIENVVSTITPEEFVEARHAIANSLMNNFESNSSIARAFLFLDRFGFSVDYFDTRADKLKKVTLQSMKDAVLKVLNNNKLLTLRIGRVGKETKKS